MSALRAFSVRAAPARGVACRATDRPMWLPGAQAPAHLTGKLAGDRGFDPLGLGSDADRLKWCVLNPDSASPIPRWALCLP